MPKTLTEVTRDAAELPAPERLKLARILLDLSETAEEPAGELEAVWDKEITRRWHELRSRTHKSIPLADVKKRMETRFRS